jgi:DNA-binding transcriptional LysR family regulator
MISPQHHTESLECLPVGTDDFSLAVSSSLFPDASTESISKIVNTLPLILPSFVEPPFMKLIIHELQKISGVQKVDITYVNTTDSVMLEASLGLGFGIVPTSLTKSKSGSDNISYINLLDFSAKSSIVMIYKPDPSGFLKSFINIIKNSCSL